MLVIYHYLIEAEAEALFGLSGSVFANSNQALARLSTAPLGVSWKEARRSLNLKHIRRTVDDLASMQIVESCFSYRWASSDHTVKAWQCRQRLLHCCRCHLSSKKFNLHPHPHFFLHSHLFSSFHMFVLFIVEPIWRIFFDSSLWPWDIAVLISTGNTPLLGEGNTEYHCLCGSRLMGPIPVFAFRFFFFFAIHVLADESVFLCNENWW